MLNSFETEVNLRNNETEKSYTKQVIVVNKGLNMSPGKLAAQVAHASEAFLLKQFLIGTGDKHSKYDMLTKQLTGYVLQVPVDIDTFEWITYSYTKVVLEVNSEAELEKVVNKAIKAGMKEDIDYFKIIDNGYTEFNNHKTWTCIGFKPMKSEDIDKVTKRLRLFRED